MSKKKLRNQLPFMMLFPRQSKESLKTLLRKKSSQELIDCICEICLNVIKINVPMTMDQKGRRARYKNIIRLLAIREQSLKKKKQKKKLLIQKVGSFLPILFSIAAPIMTRLIGGL